MDSVRETALKKEWLIRAVDSPYEIKDKLKQRNYQWRPDGMPNGKVWWTVVEDPDSGSHG